MRLIRDARAGRTVFRAGGFLAVLVALAACGSNSGGRSIAKVLMGPPGPQQETGLTGQRAEAAGGPPCPQVVVRNGTETLRVYEGGATGDPRKLRYQGGITRVARECSFEGETAVTMRIGIAGRLITGPVGQPGDYTLPIRTAMVRPGGEPVWGELYNVRATVLPGEGNARFTHVVEGVRVELPPGERLDGYVIYVGFDEMTG